MSGKHSAIMFPGRKKKKNEDNRRRRTIIYALIITALTLVILAGLGLATVLSGEFFVDSSLDLRGEEARQHIEDTLNTSLPDTATNTHYFYTAWIDFFLHIRLDLPAEDVPAFLESIEHLCFAMPLESNIMPFVTTANDKAWWQPRQAEQFIGAPQCGNNPYWHLMIDRSDRDTWIVYIEVFST